jgi:hypothetical protein
MRFQQVAAFALLSWLLVPVVAQAPESGAKLIFLDSTEGTATSVDPPQKKRPMPSRHKPIARPNSSGSTPLGLSYWIELREKAGSPGKKVTDLRVFHSGERIRLHFRSNADGRIMLVQLAASGRSSVLFPDPEKLALDNHLAAGEDRVLPSEKSWFLFDRTAGSERLVVLFARTEEDLDSFRIQRTMDAVATLALLRDVGILRGGKDLLLETETENAAQTATYAVTPSGKPIVLEIELHHQ